MRGMIRDWSASRPFKYIRGLFGITKPTAAQWGEWDDWEKNTKRDHPIGYWMSETLPDILESTYRIFADPISEIRYYYRNRFRDHLHVLPTRLKIGKYYDLDERLLHAIMESIVDYVEVDLASSRYWDEDKHYVVVNRRCPQAGLDHLAWEMSLDDTTVQPERAKEVLEIYKWWKEVRPLRIDPYVASGWAAYSESSKSHTGDSLGNILDERIVRSEEDIAETRRLIDKTREIEEQQLLEDEQMLIRVMKVRPHLWT